MNFLRVTAVYIIIFSQMLDTSVANLSLNNIASDLQLDILHASWIMTSFGVGLVIAFPAGTMLSKYISSDSVLLVGGVVFIYSSIGCGLASDDTTFLFNRFLQGLGSGMTLVVAQNLMLRIMGEDKRAFAISLWSSAISIAPVLGPVVGAYITDSYHWRWLFLLNVPLIGGSMLILLSYLALGLSEERSESNKYQLFTFLLFSILICSLQFVLDFGEKLNWLSNNVILTATILFLLSSILFYNYNRNEKYKIYDFSIFKNNRFLIATVVLTLANALVYSSIILLPLWLKMEYKMPILAAGLIVSIGSGVAAIASPFIGKLIPERLLGPTGVASLILGFISFFMMSLITIDSSPEYIALTRLVAGAGLAVMTMPLLAYSVSQLPTKSLVNANAVSLTIRISVANIFVTFAFIAYKKIEIYKQAKFTSSFNSSSLAKYDEQSIQLAYGLIKKTFYTGAMQTIFTFSSIIFLIGSILVIWSLYKSNKSEKSKPDLS
ncbi:DHA2 family efflux MFS transporter permease subunit [Pseudoalteromonas luteoviolacea]|uniref:DHA2 family efflux MFS transporter permease subunit n=1 Tax=Pseudoalteromonas luteoviolacea TaxID=43657 RepID=UPI001B3A0B7E|nr:DHA2 family efflux MFS transporter permease subunit [Pseudoalteromonas luteoviolacea]